MEGSPFLLYFRNSPIIIRFELLLIGSEQSLIAMVRFYLNPIARCSSNHAFFIFLKTDSLPGVISMNINPSSITITDPLQNCSGSVVRIGGSGVQRQRSPGSAFIGYTGFPPA